MENFNGENNRLTSFPVQPKMKIFIGENDQLTNFPVQPKMKYFYGNESILQKKHFKLKYINNVKRSLVSRIQYYQYPRPS